jgi:hypothetical protein
VNHFSRRDFIHAGCTVAAASLIPSIVDRAEAGFGLHGSVSAPPSSGGLAQVNLNSNNPQQYGLDFPFIDCGKTLTNWQLAGSGTSSVDIFSLLNSNGFPTSIPSGSSNWRSQTKGYLTSLGTWILDWDGTATIQAVIGGGAGQQGIQVAQGTTTANSVEYTVTGVNANDVTFTGVCAPSGGNTQITISGATANTVWPGQRLVGTGIPNDAVLGGQISGTNGGNGVYNVQTVYPVFSTSPGTVTLKAYQLGEAFGAFIEITEVTVAPTKIRFYRSDEATRLNAGFITSQHFVDFYKAYGCLRFMDWQRTNGALTALWVNRPKMSNFSWLGNVLTAYCGKCTQASGTNDYTAPNTISGSPTTWTDGMRVEVCFPTIPTTVNISGISIGTTTTITTAAPHGFTTGQHVMFPNDGGIVSSGGSVSIANAVTWTNPTGALVPCSPDFTITVTDPTTFTLNGVNSTGWGTYVSGGMVMAALRVATSSLPLKRCINQDTQNIYVETINQFLNGTNFGNQGTPYTLTYNAAMDALFIQLSPADDNGQLLGTPIEVITQISNEVGVAPWVNIPINASDDWFLQTATYLFNNLTPTLRARIEISNEIWNPGFMQRTWAQVMAGLQLGLVGSGGAIATDAYFQWQGWRHYNAMAQVDSVYSGAMNRIYRVMGTNGNNGSSTSQTTQQFEAPNAGLPSGAFPYQRTDALATAPYINPDPSLYPTAEQVYNFKVGNTAACFSSLDAAFNSAGNGNQSVLDFRTIFNPFWVGIAAQYGLEYHNYEGGWNVIPSVYQHPTSFDPGTGPVSLSSADAQEMWNTYKTSSNWAALWANNSDSVLKTFRNSGGKFASPYWLTTGYWNQNSMWGIWTPNLFGVPTPYYASSQPTPEMTAFEAYNAGTL